MLIQQLYKGLLRVSTDRQIMLEEKTVGDCDAKGTRLRIECDVSFLY